MGLVSGVGMVAVGAWFVSTAVLVAAAAWKGALSHLYILPDLELLGPGSLRIFTNICACFCLLTTANSCQLQAAFIVRLVLDRGLCFRNLLMNNTCPRPFAVQLQLQMHETFRVTYLCSTMLESTLSCDNARLTGHHFKPNMYGVGWLSSATKTLVS